MAISIINTDSYVQQLKESNKFLNLKENKVLNWSNDVLVEYEIICLLNNLSEDTWKDKESFNKILKIVREAGLILSNDLINNKDSLIASIWKNKNENSISIILAKEHGLALKFVKVCIGKNDDLPKKIVGEVFNTLWKNDRNLALSFAQSCIENDEEEGKKVVLLAFDKLLVESPSNAAFLAKACIGKKDEVSLSIVKSAFIKLLKKNNHAA